MRDGSASFKMCDILAWGKLGSMGTYAAPAFHVPSSVRIVLENRPMIGLALRLIAEGRGKTLLRSPSSKLKEAYVFSNVFDRCKLILS